VARHLQRQRLGKAMHAGLGGGVVGLAKRTLLAIDRRDVDDAPRALRHHRLDGLLADVEDAVEVGAQHGVPVLRAHLAKAAVAGDAGVVDQQVEAPHFGQQFLHHPFAIGVIGDVDPIAGKAEAIVALDGQPGFRRLVAGRIGRRHAVACRLQATAHGRAQAAHSTRYQRYFLVHLLTRPGSFAAARHARREQPSLEVADFETLRKIKVRGDRAVAAGPRRLAQRTACGTLPGSKSAQSPSTILPCARSR
jgi:hypothetical protein